MKKLYRSNMYFLIVLLGEIFIPIGLYLIYKSLNISDTRIMLALNHTCLFLVPAAIYFIVTKSSVKETLRLNKLHLKDAGLIVLIALFAYPFMTCFSAISSYFVTNDLGTYMTSISSTPYIVMVLLFGVMPAITEEITLRGIVLSGYNGKSKLKAALMVGLLFGIFHLDAHQLLYTAALGFIMAYLVRITNSIYASMLLHFLVNTGSVTLQKVVEKFASSVDMSTAAAESIDLTQLSLNEKASAIYYWVMAAILIGGIIYMLIRTLEKWNDERNLANATIEVDGSEATEAIDEKIINVPFIATIIVYILYMLLELFI